MKKLLLSFMVICSFIFVLPTDADGQRKSGRSRKYTKSKSSSSQTSSRRGNLIRGPRGGCYYINRNGNKTYVARSLCN